MGLGIEFDGTGGSTGGGGGGRGAAGADAIGRSLLLMTGVSKATRRV